MDKILEIHKPLYLNSKDYFSKDWRPKQECSVYSNRKLCEEEIVFDFDKLTSIWSDCSKICSYFNQKGFKFWLYQSGEQGLHLHLFINGIKNKHQKAKFIEIISKQLELEIDVGPNKRGWIRAEGSLHPTKGFKKVLLYTNVHTMAYICRDFYMNYIFGHNAQKVFNQGFSGTPRHIPDDLVAPYTIDQMLYTKFNDGIKRVLFCLVSFWKSKKLSDEVIFNKSKNWVEYQGANILDSHIKATIKSSSGLVRDGYRQKLLEELGVDYKPVPEIKSSECGF